MHGPPAGTAHMLVPSLAVAAKIGASARRVRGFSGVALVYRTVPIQQGKRWVRSKEFAVRRRSVFPREFVSAKR
jgi:hypothetical protein